MDCNTYDHMHNAQYTLNSMQTMLFFTLYPIASEHILGEEIEKKQILLFFNSIK